MALRVNKCLGAAPPWWWHEWDSGQRMRGAQLPPDRGHALQGNWQQAAGSRHTQHSWDNPHVNSRPSGKVTKSCRRSEARNAGPGPPEGGEPLVKLKCPGGQRCKQSLGSGVPTPSLPYEVDLDQATMT